VGEEKKMLGNEKYGNNPSIYAYNIMYFTVSYPILEEY
jgi:hypothetical protein